VSKKKKIKTPLRIDKSYLEEFDAAFGGLLQAVAAHPRGQVEYTRNADLVSKIAALCSLFPAASTLIIAWNEPCAIELTWDLDRYLGDQVGLYTLNHARDARCQVTTRATLRHLGPTWHLVLPVVYCRQHLTESACQAVASFEAQRVYTLLHRSLRLGKRTRLRLESVSGPLIATVGE
jgi:hypothetical protein